MRRWWLAFFGGCMCAVVACSSNSRSASSATTVKASHLSSVFCDSLRRAWQGPSFNTSDTVSPDQFASDVILGYRRELPFLQSAYAHAPPAVARQMKSDLALVRSVAHLDPDRATGRTEATHVLSIPDSAADRQARDGYLSYANDHCHAQPPTVEAPGGRSVSASTSTG